MPEEDQKLTAKNLIKHGLKPVGDYKGGAFDEDSMSDAMTARTAEADLGPTENILDLTVFDVEYDQQVIARQILNMDHPMESAVQSFLTVDFFNHDTQNTEVKSGFNPKINQKFSFRNNVDEFYLNYLTNQMMLVEVYMIMGKRGAPEKIGEAKLVLSSVITGDASKYPVKITSEKYAKTVGTMMFRLKMQKPLTSALQYHQLRSKSAVEHEEGLKKLSTKSDLYTLPRTAANKMIFEINIKKAYSLRRLDSSFNPSKMQPFFSFDFYTFEYRSPTLHGDSPDIDVV